MQNKNQIEIIKVLPLFYTDH